MVKVFLPNFNRLLTMISQHEVALSENACNFKSIVLGVPALWKQILKSEFIWLFPLQRGGVIEPRLVHVWLNINK